MNSSEILKLAQEFNRKVDENKAQDDPNAGVPFKTEPVSNEDKNKVWDRFEKRVNRNRRIPVARAPYFNQLQDSMIDTGLPSEEKF